MEKKEIKSPLLSIIVPVYKVEEWLPACIDSILAQTFTDWELILVDDGSPDNSGKICDEYAKRDSRIIVIHKQNEGVSAARNDGIKKAQGKYLTFVDSDDELGTPTTLEGNIQLLEKNPHIDILQYPHQYITDDKRSFSAFPINVSVFVGRKNIIEAIANQIILGYLWNKIFRRELFDSIKLRPDLSYCEDLWCIIDLAQKAKAVMLSPLGLYNYFSRQGSATVNYTEAMCHNLFEVDFRLLHEVHVEGDLKKAEFGFMFFMLKSLLNTRINYNDVFNLDSETAKLHKVFSHVGTKYIYKLGGGKYKGQGLVYSHKDFGYETLC